MDVIKHQFRGLDELEEAFKRGEKTPEYVQTMMLIYNCREKTIGHALHALSAACKFGKKYRRALFSRGIDGDAYLPNISIEEAEGEVIFCEGANCLLTRRQCLSASSDAAMRDKFGCPECDFNASTRRLLLNRV